MEEQKATILIVDDERANLNILAFMLKAKYKVIVAKNGKQALERARNQLPDLVLLDLIMPEMDGYQVLYDMKNDERSKDIPVIFISALNNDEDEEKGLVLGAVDYISKPFSQAIVLARVDNQIKLARQRKLIENIALLDGLTEIPNRRNYAKRLSMEIARAVRENTPLSLLMVDIDFFKQFNDNYGHSKGDEALKLVATTISNTILRPADFAARIGGEEFAVLLPNTQINGACHLAELLRVSIEALGIPHQYSAVSPVLTVSIGGNSCWPDQETDLQELVNLADKMLHKAKNEGRNRVIWYQ